MKNKYFDSIMQIERLHRLFLEVIDKELDAMGVQDVSNVQCFMLYNIGRNKLTVGEITNRGYYLGSNVTYNLKKMVEIGYIIQEASVRDRRSSHVRLSDKGIELYERFEKMLERHAENIEHNGITQSHLVELTTNLRKMESFWSFMVSHRILNR